MNKTLAAVILSLSCAMIAPAAAPTCTVGSLAGTYGYTITGSTVPGPLPFGLVGRIGFSGAGTAVVKQTVSNNGVIVRNEIGKAGYSVSSDCTGTLSISIPTIGMVNFDLVLDDDNRELRAVAVNPGLVLTLEGRKQANTL